MSIPLFLMFLLESSFHLLNITKISYHNIMAKAQDIMPKLNSNSIIFLGDSRIEWGIKPKLIENPEGEVYNLAFPGSNGLDLLAYLSKNKIYPKIIIIGFTPNYGRYSNHGMDNIILSYKNRITEDLKYFLLQKSYLYDKESIKLNFQGKTPYFIDHKYDCQGGVTVVESGNYDDRKTYQKKMYKDWYDNFDKEKYQFYLKNLTNLLNKFKGKSHVFGLYMPVSNEIFELEKENYNSNDIARAVDYYFDYSSLISAKDSINRDEYYFYDGSHLSPEYAIIFTKKLSSALKARTHNKNIAASGAER